MKTAEMIFLDYRKAQEQASLFEALASETLMEADKGEASVSGLSGIWTGSQAAQYFRKNSEIWEQVRSMGYQLRAAADSIRSISATTYYAEMTALQLAEIRNQ